jgi:hypothetical protein
MGQIMDKMGYEYETYSLSDLENKSKFTKLDILFINCVSDDPTIESKKNIEEFVGNGGALYASCFADKWIDALFPEYVSLNNIGSSQDNLDARVVDPGLKDYLQEKSIKLHYNTVWHGVTKIHKVDGSDAVKVYLRGTPKDKSNEEALLISFPYKKGFVIFTTFHNEKQVSKIEYKLLEYLVLKPLMHEKDTEAKTIMQTQQFRPTKDIVGALEVGEETGFYEFITDKIYDLKFVFNWQGNATVRITINDPAGNKIKDENVRQSPSEVDVQGAKAGKWTFKMKIIDAPLKKFPFTINVGLKDAVQRQMQAQNVALAQNRNTTNSNAPTNSPFNQPPVVVSASKPVTPATPTVRINFMLISPFQQALNPLNLSIGTPLILGRKDLPNNVPGKDNVSSKHIEVTLLKNDEIQITDLSSNGTAAQTYLGGPYQLTNLQKNIPTKLKLPLVVQLSNSIMLGLWK